MAGRDNLGAGRHVAIAYGTDDQTLEADRVARHLADCGAMAKTLLGGFRAWQERDLPIAHDDRQ
jgi:hypothetical protein